MPLALRCIFDKDDSAYVGADIGLLRRRRALRRSQSAGGGWAGRSRNRALPEELDEEGEAAPPRLGYLLDELCNHTRSNGPTAFTDDNVQTFIESNRSN
jgi:hypothetical protein